MAFACLSDIGRSLGTSDSFGQTKIQQKPVSGCRRLQKFRTRCSSALWSRLSSLLATTKSIMPWTRTRLKERSSAGVVGAELVTGFGAGLVAACLASDAMQPAQVASVAQSNTNNTQPIPRKTLAPVLNEATPTILS
jgi:hypothetical protein